ncbi:regulatory protein RecX [Pseudotenacibaculum sp. MALMAid0570]|uniref:regulatory protein RecX n=1 Tax=Pseudotenacibaculum sp. MALMAid0570 TaxID=3143938 RepID=UPI0032E031D4
MTQKVFTVDEIKKKLEYFCVYQDRCHQEVEKKLSEFRLIPEARELILLHLMQHDFLNEERYAKSFARGKFRIKKWGRKRIIQELKFRKITTYNINSALKEIEEKEYLTTLEKIAEIKLKSINEKNEYLKKQKLYQFLYRKGYESDLIQQVIKEII